jgi:AsmA protein
MRRLRIIVTVLGGIALLVMAAALAAPYAVDTAPARQAVSTWMSGLLGRQVQIQGTMRFTLLPIFGFVIEDFSLAGPDGAVRQPLARIQQASMTVAPWPLIRREVVVETIHLQGPQIRLIRNADGSANWQGLSMLSRDETTRAEKSAALMQFEQVTVSDGTLHLQDAVAGRDVVISNIAFRRRGRGSRTFVLGAQAECRQSPLAGLEQVSAVLRMTGDAVVQPDREHYAVENADLHLTLRRQPSADALPLAVLEAVVSADVFKRHLKLEKLRMTGRGAHLEGTVSGQIQEGTPTVDALVDLQIEALQDLLVSLGIHGPSGAGYRLPRTAALKMALSARPGRLSLTRLQGTVDEIPVAGSLAMAVGRPLSCQMKLSTGELDLNAYLPSEPDRNNQVTTPPAPALALDLSLDAKALSWKNHRIEQAAVQIGYRPGGKIEVETATGRFAGGTWKLAGRLQPMGPNWAGRLVVEGRDAAVTELFPTGTPSPFVSGRLDLDADLNADNLDLNHFFEGVAGKIVISTRRPLQAVGEEQIQIQGRLAAVLAQDHRLTLDGEVDSRHPDLKIAWKSAGTWDPRTLALDGHRTSLSVVSPSLPGSGGPLHLDGDLSLSLPRQRAVWRDTRISFPRLGISARGDLDLGRVDGTPVIDARLDIQPLSLGSFLAKLGWNLPPLTDPAVPGQMQAAVRFNYDGKQLAVRDFDLHLDDSRVRGTVDITALKPFQGKFDLVVDRINLDRYFPRGDDGPDGDGHPWDAGSVDLRGALTIGRLTLFDLEAVDVSARVTMNANALRFDPVQLTLYEGATAGLFEVSLDDSEPVWQTRATVNGAQLRQPLEILFHRPILSGKSDIEADLYQRRKKTGPTVAGLNGKLNFTVRNGRMHGVRIVSEAGDGRGQADTSDKTTDKDEPFQPFDLLEGHWTLTDGIAVGENHQLNATGLKMSAAGQVDFIQDHLDATLSVDLVAFPLVYYSLEGPFGDIKVRMDRTRLVLDTTSGIVTSPLKLGQGTLGKGAEILDRGGQAIGDHSGVQKLGQGAMTVGKGVLEVGKGVLELHKGGESIGEGAKSVGEGVAGMGKGVVGMGRDALGTGLQALEEFGKGLERLFGGSGEKSPSAEGDEAPN